VPITVIFFMIYVFDSLNHHGINKKPVNPKYVAFDNVVLASPFKDILILPLAKHSYELQL